jgi:hypothetical protein
LRRKIDWVSIIGNKLSVTIQKEGLITGEKVVKSESKRNPSSGGLLTMFYHRIET